MNIIFLFFNRLEVTKRVFAEIAKQKPERLFLVADGPRNSEEEKTCAGVRQHVLSSIDWDCEVFENFSSINLGCRNRVSSGITWAFEHIEDAIIIEDDCLPDPSFFPYCKELLECYKNNEKIMMISGNNAQFGQIVTEDSYYFSQYPRIWGWATWKRAWDLYDVSIKDWQTQRNQIFSKYDVDAAFWTRAFDLIHKNFNTWDYQWVYTIWKNEGKAITPSINLIKNIGFGPEGTHCLSANDKFANQPTFPLTFPLKHPSFFDFNKKADDFERYSHFKI